MAVALGYGRFTFSRRLRSRGWAVLDFGYGYWQVSGPVLIVYGLELTDFGRASGTSVLPSFGVAMDAGAAEAVSNLTPGLPRYSIRINLESGEVNSQSQTGCAGHTPGLRAAGNGSKLSIGVGGEQILSDKSSIEMMALWILYRVTESGCLRFRMRAQQLMRCFEVKIRTGHTRGVRVVYHRRVNKLINGSVGSAFGEGHSLIAVVSASPAHCLATAFFMSSQQRWMRTSSARVRESHRIATCAGQAIFAIDPFKSNDDLRPT